MPQMLLEAARAALRRGDLQACWQAASAVLQLHPDDVQANYMIGLVLVRSGRVADGVRLLTLVHQTKPRDLDVMLALGEAGLRAGDPAAAGEWFAKAAARDAGSAQGWLGLAIASRMSDRLEEAAHAGRRALTLDPDNREAIEVVRDALLAAGWAEEALAHLEPILARHPEDAALRQLAIFPRLYAQPDPRPLADMLKGLGGQLAGVCPPLWKGFDNQRDPARRLRIGYISREFHNRWAPRFIGPLIEFRDPALTELFCYYQTVVESEKTAAKSPNATWRDTTNLNDEQFARLVRQDRIDILVDLTGWIHGSRLPAMCHAAAPVQVTYLGFPATTGVPAVSYRIVDSITDPDGYEAFASEQLVRMPHCFVCPQPNIAPPVEPPPCTRGKPITFGSFNSLVKIGRPVLALWAKVLQAVPGSRLLIKNQSLGREPARARVRSTLESMGVPGASIELRPETPGEDEHLRCYGELDVALDPFPYNGTTTTFDALWMGVPVVTLPGRSHVSRVTSSMLHAAGYPDDVATSEDAYVARCAALVGDKDALAARRSAQRDQVARSRLCDGPAFVRELETRYRDMWARWCQAAP